MQSCKKKNNKTLSSFHASFCRTGFFWATTLLNLIYHSIWFKLCLVPFFFSFTWAPTSIFLGFHPQRIFPFHPSFGLPFIFLPSSHQTSFIPSLPVNTPTTMQPKACGLLEEKVYQLLCLEAGETSFLTQVQHVSGTVRTLFFVLLFHLQSEAFISWSSSSLICIGGWLVPKVKLTQIDSTEMIEYWRSRRVSPEDVTGLQGDFRPSGETQLLGFGDFFTGYLGRW